MKRFLTLAALVVAMLAAACSKYTYETVDGDPIGARIYTLDNGLKVYMAVNDETPRIQTYIAVRVGGKNDPAETTGLAHYFEHLMFKGTPSFGTQDYAAEKPLLDEIEQLFEQYRKTTDEAERKAIYHVIDSISYEASKIAIPNEYDKLMSAIGAEGTNAYTSQDVTCYVENIPSNQIENWAKIEADRFMNPVIRGFHTELETIYEEKNMSLTRDSRKVWEALDAALFPNHPYGKQTVLGSQEHLKNPSITNVKNYHKTYYVPNNMAICLSGDFDPDEMIAVIDKYFGQMQPNPELPTLQFEQEQPITTPVVREVFGLEAENVTIGWRTGGATSEDADIMSLVGDILTNGKAGLFDLNLNQQQKVLSAFASAGTQPDYGTVMMQGRPKTGQSLEEVRDLMLAEVEKLRKGEWDEQLLEASINNYKVQQMQYLDSNEGRADIFVNTFVNGEEWANVVNELDRLSKITKEQVVAWANEKLGAESYAIIYKRQGKDPNEQKIAKPAITPIVTNRDKQSAFLTEIQQSVVEPIEPKFVDYATAVERFTLDNGVEVLYKQNTTTDLFRLTYLYNTGSDNNPLLNIAFDYLDYLATTNRTAEEQAIELYNIAGSYRILTAVDRSYATLSGLGSAGTALAANSIDFVDENNGRSDPSCLGKQVTDTAGAHAHIQFHKVGAGQGQKLHIRLPGHRAGQQRFTGAGRANQQNAMGNAGTDLGVLLGVPQEVHHLGQFFLFLVSAGYILKGYYIGIGHAQSGTGLAEIVHGVIVVGLAHQQKPDHQQCQAHDQQRQDQIIEAEALFRGKMEALDDAFGVL